MITLVNTCVFSVTQNRTLLTWTILKVSDEEQTVGEFYNNAVIARLPSIDTELLSAAVGTEKDDLDNVDLNLPVVPVIKSFGHFLKFAVESANNGDSMSTAQVTSSDAAAATADLFFIESVRERNKKDKLCNSIIHFFKSRNAFVKESEVHLTKKLVLLLRDIFWHIDGHHHVFEQRAIAIPSVFNEFNRFNTPELSKHRKRLTGNISCDQLREFALGLTTVLQENYWDREHWSVIKPYFLILSQSLDNYADYLCQKNKRMKINHRSPTPVRELSANLKVKFIAPSVNTSSLLQPVEDSLSEKSPYEYVFITPLLPSDPAKKHRSVETLISNGLSFPLILLVYSSGNNVGNLHFIWKVPNESEPTASFEESQSVIEDVKKHIPMYHTRTMRKKMYEKFGRVSCSIKPSILRYFYKELTGDQSSAITTNQADVDKRISQIIDMEDCDIVEDLRMLNTGQQSHFDSFWDECWKFLNEEISTAVDDRRHCRITHLAHAVSVRDFIDQVKARCPDGTAIPSLEWVRLQFWPKTPAARVSVHYTGRFPVKFMVQQRQWRHHHVDSHYAAASFRYMREYALTIRDYCAFVSIDDKHRIKIGEPNYPVASAERGRRVPVGINEYLVVGDHDFTKFSLIPSVVFIIDIPEEISDTWYSGTVFVGLKDAVFQPSSPFRHMCELYNILCSVSFSKSILFLYSDGGPDHRLTYVSVKLSLICLFLKLDLDYLCAGRTAPYHSWRNPVERIMSILNLGLQCVGLARAEMPAEFEKEVKKCSNISELRRISSCCNGIEAAVQGSLSPVKSLLNSIFTRLKLHEETFCTFESASPHDISDFWSTIIALDATLEEGGTYRKDNISSHHKIVEFINHCCKCSHYTFDILKCGQNSCTICKPIKVPVDVFKKLRHFPHPTPGEDGHYLPFSNVFHTETTEEHRPSFKKTRNGKTLPFTPTVQHVKNCQVMVQCSECNMWRLLFSKYKLKKEERTELQNVLNEYTYTCGAKLSELHLQEKYSNIEIDDHNCGDIIEKLYYKAKLPPICIYCGEDEPYSSELEYPICVNCKKCKPGIKK